MRAIRISLFYMCIFVVVFFTGGILGLASEKTQSGFGFLVEPIFTESQIDNNLPFFYIGVEPNQTQEVKVMVRSVQPEPLEIETTVYSAVTGDNGKVNYNPINPIYDKTLIQPITELVKLKDPSNKIQLNGYEEKIVTYEIVTPTDPFEGIKLGALSFKKIETQKEQHLTNIKGYNIGLILTEDKATYNQGGDIKMKGIGLGLDKGYKSIKIDFQNPKPKLISDLEMKIEVIDKKTKEVVQEYNKTDMSMAPNSNFTLAIPLDIESIKVRTYEVNIKATSSNESWEFQEDIKVNEKVAREFNEQSEKKYTISRTLMLVSFFMIVINIVLFVIKYHQVKIDK